MNRKDLGLKSKFIWNYLLINPVNFPVWTSANVNKEAES